MIIGTTCVDGSTLTNGVYLCNTSDTTCCKVTSILALDPTNNLGPRYAYIDPINLEFDYCVCSYGLDCQACFANSVSSGSLAICGSTYKCIMLNTSYCHFSVSATCLYNINFDACSIGRLYISPRPFYATAEVTTDCGIINDIYPIASNAAGSYCQTNGTIGWNGVITSSSNISSTITNDNCVIYTPTSATLCAITWDPSHILVSLFNCSTYSPHVKYSWLIPLESATGHISTTLYL